MDQPQKVTGRRIVAMIIDSIPGFALFWGLVTAVGTEVGQRPGTNITMVVEVVNGELMAELMGTVYRLEPGPAALVSLAGMAYWIGLLVVVQGLTGRTIGKAVTGIRTVDEHGRPCGVGRAFVRYVLLLVDAFPYVIWVVGFIVTVSSPSRQRVGDRVARTWVIRASAAGPPVPAWPGYQHPYAPYAQPPAGQAWQPPPPGQWQPRGQGPAQEPAPPPEPPAPPPR